MENEEIDLIELAAKLWIKRKIIAFFVVFFIAGGVLIAFLSPRKYTAECTLGLETREPITRISLEGASAFNNMNVGDLGRANIVSPAMYPEVVFSAPFQKELIYSPLFVNEQGDTVTFYSYLVKSENQNRISKELINLGVEQLTEGEGQCFSYLEGAITIVNGKHNDLKITVEMPDAQVAAQMAYRVQTLLQTYITNFRTAKAKLALDFIEERCQDTKNELEEKQQALIEFREKHPNFNSIRLKSEEKILNNDYELFFELYSSVIKQREKARIQVKEEMAVLTVIEPVIEPRSPSKPKRMMIVLASAFLGLFVGCGWVFASNYFNSIKELRK